jgi:hypothetical protein
MKGLGPEARALIDAASHEESLPSEQALRRVRRSVAFKAMAASAAVATTTAATGAKAGVLGGGFALRVAAMAMAGALTGGAVIMVSIPWRPAAHAVPAPAARAEALPRAAPALVPTSAMNAPAPLETTGLSPEAAPELAPSTVRAAQPRSMPERRTAPPAPRVAEPAPSAGQTDVSTHDQVAPVPPRSGDLALQLQVLRRAREALRNRRADEVLAILDQYDSSFRDSALEEEARTARIAALCQLGREEDARRQIAEIARRWPQSPATRQSGCARDGATRIP